MPREKPLDVPRLWRDLDRPQDLAAADLKAALVPPPLDALVLRREHERLAKKARKERKQASMTVPLDSLLDEPSVPDHTEAVIALDAFRAMCRGLTETQARVVGAMVSMGMTRREVARQLGMTRRGVTRALQRASEAIKNTVAPD